MADDRCYCGHPITDERTDTCGSDRCIALAAADARGELP